MKLNEYYNIALGSDSLVEEYELKEETVKQGKKWVNKGEDGTHGKFNTKKEADAQRKAMFANGYKESLNEGMFDQAFYNTQEIIDNTTGKNKSFISRIAKHQEEKYGNVDIFDASLKYGEVRIGFGDYSLTFFFDNEGNIEDVTGNGQGSKYQSSLEAVAKELYKKFGIENGFLGEE